MEETIVKQSVNSTRTPACSTCSSVDSDAHFERRMSGADDAHEVEGHVCNDPGMFLPSDRETTDHHILVADGFNLQNYIEPSHMCTFVHLTFHQTL